jgi:hypothetical protein
VMFRRLISAIFAPKYPRHYIGRHRAPGRWPSIPRQRTEGLAEPLTAALRK